MVAPVLLLLLGIAAILVIIAANGYFVAKEFAYMAVDRSQLKKAADEGDQSSVQALKVTHRTSFMLSGGQLGITVTGLLVGYVAEPLAARIWAPSWAVLGYRKPSVLAWEPSWRWRSQRSYK